MARFTTPAAVHVGGPQRFRADATIPRDLVPTCSCLITCELS